ncbi:hypothetical protein DZG01_05955 [Pseudomonas fluorescens]|nr:hypothetical protein DZG01_05955 [Pseudomonas fluorescens]
MNYRPLDSTTSVHENAHTLWEQGLPAKQATRFQIDHVIFIAGKPCSHKVCTHSSLATGLCA